MESDKVPEESFIIKDLETGKQYRITENGDRIEVADGEAIPLDEFMKHLGQSKSSPGSIESLDAMSNCSESPTGTQKNKGPFSQFMQKSKFTTPSELNSSREENTTVSPHVYVSKRNKKELSDLRLVQELNAHTGVIWVARFSPNGKWLATGGKDAVICLWEVMEDRGSVLSENKSLINIPVFDPTPKKTWTSHKSDILDLSWASGSEFLLSASLDKAVRLWHINMDQCLREFQHANYVTSIQFHPLNSEKFISGSGDGVIRLWNIADMKVIASASITSEKDIFTALCFSDDGKRILAGCFEGRCRLYDIVGGRLEKHADIDVKNRRGIHHKGKKVTGIVQANREKNSFLVSTNDSRIRLLQGTTPCKVTAKFKGHTNYCGRPIAASPSPSGDHMISGSDDGRVFVWPLNNHSQNRLNSLDREKVSSYESFQAHEGFCPVALFAPMTTRRNFENINLENQIHTNIGALMKLLGSQKGEVRAGENEYSMWGQVLVTVGNRGEIKVWENFDIPKKLG